MILRIVVSYWCFVLIICMCFNGGNGEISKKQNRYLVHLFNKYGSQGTMSFEVSRLLRLDFDFLRDILMAAEMNVRFYQRSNFTFETFGSKKDL